MEPNVMQLCACLQPARGRGLPCGRERAGLGVGIFQHTVAQTIRAKAGGSVVDCV